MIIMLLVSMTPSYEFCAKVAFVQKFNLHTARKWRLFARQFGKSSQNTWNQWFVPCSWLLSVHISIKLSIFAVIFNKTWVNIFTFCFCFIFFIFFCAFAFTLWFTFLFQLFRLTFLVSCFLFLVSCWSFPDLMVCFLNESYFFDYRCSS